MSANDVKQYSPDNVVITWGPYQFTGYADGTFVRVERVNPKITESEGADGTISIIRNPGKLHTVTVTLAQTSPTNTALSAALAAADLAGTDALVLPMTISDKGGSTLVAASKGWVRSPAAIERAKGITNAEWEFGIIADEFINGGN